MSNNYCPRCDKEFEEGWDWQKHECYISLVKAMDKLDATANEISVGKLACTCAKDTCEYVNKDSLNYHNQNCKFIGVKMSKQESLTDFDKAKIGYDKISVYEKEIWNAAIEAAACQVDGGEAAYHIRKLKK